MTGRRPAGAPRLTRALGLAGLVCLALLFSAAPVGAVVTTVGGLKYGIQPQTEVVSTPTTPLSYAGGEVVHSNAPYAIYWDPADVYSGAWQALTAGLLKGIGAESGALSNVAAVATQYRDATGSNASYNSAFHGAYTDVEPYKTAGETTEQCTEGALCLTDAQIRAQLTKYISANPVLPRGLNPSTGPTPIYFMFTPPNVTVCLDGLPGHCSKPGSTEPLCSYHSYVSVEGTTVLYAVEPSTSPPISNCQDGSGTLEEPNSPADIIVNGVADELIATITDPLLTGWHDLESGDGNEVPDKCRNEFSPLGSITPGKAFNQTIANGSYYLNGEFNQAALYEPYPGVPCLNTVTVAPHFTAPNPVHSEEEVTFNASESYVDLGIAKYHWDFGDETEPVTVNCGALTPTNGHIPSECNAGSGVGSPNPVASVKHKYAYAGTYSVTLQVTDDGGNPGSFTEVITVGGRKREPEGQSGGGAAQATQGSTGSSSAAPATVTTPPQSIVAPKPPVPSPVAADAVVSRSLRKVLSKGLPIRYSVNEQVAGRFEVLLSRSAARQLGIGGPSAVGLPAGTAPQVVIGKAILVTTGAGRSTLNIQFSKRTSSRLAHRTKVTLMLRLIVRNAASQSPATTTVLSTFTLSR